MISTEDAVVSRTSLRGFFVLWLLGCAALAAGCKGGRQEVPQEESRLTKLTRLYGRSLSKSRGTPPADVAALKQFATSLGAEDLKGIGIEGDVDQLFVSPRDSEPYVYRRPAKAGMPGMGPEAVLFYEKTGKDGKRFVAYPSGKTEQVDAAKFKELVPEAAGP